MEAVAWHQLGLVYEEAQQLEAAEQAYRESARINESLGNLVGAARTWNQLAMVNKNAGKPQAAEDWYRKAIGGAKVGGDRLQVSRSLSNLAYLLQNQPHRLTEANQLASEALKIDKTIDPTASQIWKTYGLLAEIADKQGDTTQARAYRRLSQQEYAQFAGMPYYLQQHETLITVVVAAVDNKEVRQQLEAAIEEIPESWANLVTAIRAILDGERDQEVLLEPLDYDDAAIVSAILGGL